MLFLANLLSKMKHDTKLGSRVAEVHNGSSLFTGDAGQGESNIRRWVIENDWLEAIVALPLNMFYNTGIATYIWVLTNRKPEHRRGKVQLIDATQWFTPLRKDLGKQGFPIHREGQPQGLARFQLAFKNGGTVTAGNSSQTSDAAAAVVLMEGSRAAKLGLKPMAVFRGFAVGGVDPDIMGVGPIEAIPKALKIAGLKLEDIDLFELNEAFAAQAVAVIRTLGMDRSKVNVNGGAVALGHPLGCTGAKLTVTLLNEMARRKAHYGMVTMCIGGGMGAAGVFERVG